MDAVTGFFGRLFGKRRERQEMGKPGARQSKMQADVGSHPAPRVTSSSHQLISAHARNSTAMYQRSKSAGNRTVTEIPPAAHPLLRGVTGRPEEALSVVQANKLSIDERELFRLNRDFQGPE